LVLLESFQYELTMLNGQQALLARRGDGRPYFVMFIYSEGDTVQLIHVIAGRKLSSITEKDQ